MEPLTLVHYAMIGVATKYALDYEGRLMPEEKFNSLIKNAEEQLRASKGDSDSLNNPVAIEVMDLLKAHNHMVIQGLLQKVQEHNQLDTQVAPLGSELN